MTHTPSTDETMRPGGYDPTDPVDGVATYDEPFERQIADQYGRPILTVGALRALLEGRADGEHVLIAPPVSLDADWYNVGLVGLPDADGVYTAFTLYATDPYDSRQF